jgi:16S rRNA (cytosine967-C5)-methyltransferase
MRQYAYDIVYTTLENGGHSDELFHNIVKEHPSLESRDKKFIKKLAYGTIERAIELDVRLNAVSSVPTVKMQPEVRTVLRMALYEICYMNQVPDAATCHEAVELIRKKAGEHLTGFVNGVLRSYLRKKENIRVEESWQKVSLPKELMNHLISQYGKKTANKIGEAFLTKSGEISLHLDTNKISREEYAACLEKEKIPWKNGNYSDEVFLLTKVADVAALPGYEQGWFFVQDESSLLPVMCSGIKKGDTVADICSAPGGKSMHALIKLAGTGRLYARDVSEQKVAKVRENIKRMGYTNAVCSVWDATKTDSEMQASVDVIIADVPCSGIGIIGRKPEIKYHAMQQAQTLVSLQREICRQSVQMLKPGGTFIYSTCTINRAENEENVQWLENELGLVRESLNPYLPESLCNRMTETGMLQMLPGIQKSDGFFVARLRKKAM